MKKIKLVCFDLDNTILEGSSWNMIHPVLGMTKEEDEILHSKYENKKISYVEWIQEIFKIYNRGGKATLQNIIKTITPYSLKKNVKQTINYLKEKGYHLALISGSFNIMVDLVAKDLGIEMAQSVNMFVFDEKDRLNNIVTISTDSIAKLNILEDFCLKLGISIEEGACLGDGENDMAMFDKTKKGITFKGSEIENKAWKIIEDFSDLKKIL